MVAFVSSPSFVEHDTGPHHPERPDRLRALYRALHAAGLVATDPFPDFQLDLGAVQKQPRGLLELAPLPADEKWLLAVHPQKHLDRVRHVSQVGGGVLDLGDTPVCPRSYDLALLSAGALLTAADAVASGKCRRAFAAGRPPGHHAEPDRAMGFCLFSNIAIAARYLQRHHGVGKIAIVDFDVHHGNGTQAVFEADPSVFFVSLHQHPRTCYPGTGYEWEKGVGPGTGYTLNLPMTPGSGDDQYLETLRDRVLPVLDAFKPEFLLISAGFDAHADDPLAHIELSESGFEQITRLLVQLANHHCQGKILSALEGGYDLRALARSALKHLTALTEN